MKVIIITNADEEKIKEIIKENNIGYIIFGIKE